MMPLDKGLPSCHRCLKAGYECQGYIQPLRMQHHVIGTEGKGVQRLADTPQRDSIRNGAPHELSLSAFQDQIAFSYFYSTYHWAHLWKPEIERAKTTCSLSRSCSAAIAYGFLGQKCHDITSRTKGLELYGRVLRQIRNKIAQYNSKSELARLCTVIGLLDGYTVSRN